MSSGVAPLPFRRAQSFDYQAPIVPQLVEVAIPYFSGTVDEAIRRAITVAEDAATAAAGPAAAAAAAQKLNEFLSSTSISTQGLITGGGTLGENLVLAVTGANQDEANGGTSETKVITPLVLAGVISHLLTQPNVLASYLPTTLPATGGVPWLNGGVVCIS